MFDEYFKLQEEIYEYFGFLEDWVVLPFDDRRNYYWILVDEDSVQYAEIKEDIINDTGTYYQDEIYKQRFYKQWVYRGKDYSMIMVDTHTDGNRFLAIYDNKKEMKL